MPRVMIVEDDRDTREMLEQFLALEGFEVQTAANGRQALDTLAAGPPACVIVLDLMMPVMDGWQFRDAQARDPRLSSIPVVVVTAAGPRDHVAPIDAYAWFSKPLDLERVLETIDGICRPPE